MKTLQLETSTDAASSVVGDQALARLSLTPQYVTGFCEGEASFTYVRNGNSINLRFAVKLHESDMDLISSLMFFFNVGNIYHAGPRKPGPMSGNTGASWYYCVTAHDDLSSIVRHFDAYPLLGRKAESYKIWRQMYELKQTPRKVDFVTLNNLALTLSGMSTKGRRNLKPKVLRPE